MRKIPASKLMPSSLSDVLQAPVLLLTERTKGFATASFVTCSVQSLKLLLRVQARHGANLKVKTCEKISNFHLRREQVALSQFVVQLHPLFEEQLFLLPEVGDLLSDLLGVLSTATTEQTVPLGQLPLQRLDSARQGQQVFTKSLERKQTIP